MAASWQSSRGSVGPDPGSCACAAPPWALPSSSHPKITAGGGDDWGDAKGGGGGGWDDDDDGWGAGNDWQSIYLYLSLSISLSLYIYIYLIATDCHCTLLLGYALYSSVFIVKWSTFQCHDIHDECCDESYVMYSRCTLCWRSIIWRCRYDK